MKAINIGFSTEDDGLWLEEVKDLQRFEWLYFIKDGLQWGDPKPVTEALEDLDKEFQEMNKGVEYEGKDEFLAEWAAKMEKFKALVKDQPGVAISWGIEYDANLLFVFDGSVDQIKALNDVDMDDPSQYDKTTNIETA